MPWQCQKRLAPYIERDGNLYQDNSVIYRARCMNDCSSDGICYDLSIWYQLDQRGFSYKGMRHWIWMNRMIDDLWMMNPLLSWRSYSFKYGEDDSLKQLRVDEQAWVKSRTTTGWDIKSFKPRLRRRPSYDRSSAIQIRMMNGIPDESIQQAMICWL